MSNRRHAGRFGEDPVVKDDSPVSRGNPATIANDDGQSKHMDAKSKDTLLISEAIEAVGAHRVFSSQNTKNKGGNKAKGLQMAAAVVDGTGARHGSKEEKKNDDDKAKNKLSLASASEMIPSPVGVVAGTFQNNNDDKAKNKLSLASASETISASPVGVAAGTFRNNRQDASSDDDGILSDDDDDEERPGAYRISGVNGGDEDMYGDSDRPRNDGDDDVLLDADLVDPDAERQEALKEILRTSVEAQALSVDELRKRRRRWYFGGCCMLVLVAVGASLGGYYGSRSDPLELPPTVAPTVSMAPSVSPSSVPSSTPTLFHELCEKARTIESLPYFHSGTTGQTSELGDASPALSCPLISSFDRGVWFAVNGTGGCMSAVATGRNLDTKIAIYTGSCTAMLLCVTNKEEGQAEWTSQANQRYYILLVGQNSAAGDYSLSVSDIGTICNNVCEEPVHVNYLPYFFEGTTERAPFIEEPTAMTCLLDLVDLQTAGIWFSILLPETSCIYITTLGSELDTMLALYDGDDCTSLNCFAGTDDSRPDYSTDLSFQAQANQNYRLLVGNAAGTFAGQGIFTINITVPEDDGSNCGQEQYHGWFCNYEPNLFGQDHACVYYDEEESFPFADRSSFVIATCYEYPFAEPTNENCLCFVVLSESFENFGLNEICTVCSFLAGGDENDGNWDISYDCSNLISGDCVGRTEEGECIVNNATDPVFDLPEHSCLNASEIESQNLPYTTTGEFGLSSYLLEFDIDAFQCSGVGPFVYIQWFSVIGRESCLRVTSENSDVDTKLAVFKGECRSLACYRQDDDYGMTLQSRVEWYGNDGEEYHVLLSSYDLFQFGTWVLNVEEFDCDLDKACASSIEIDELPYLDSGSSANGPVQFAGSQALTCPVVKPDIRGVWYAGQAISESCITVSTAGSQFDTVLAVYTGSCDNLSCLVENDNESELVRSSQVSWTAEPETLYYLFLGGVDLDAAGDFQISVTMRNGPC